MSVRWKPLIILSCIFLMVGVVGLCVYALAPSDARNILPLAQAEWKAKKYERADIQFQRALKKDPKNAEVHEQLAAMYAEWADAVPARRAELRAKRLRSLAEAAKYGKQRAEPRRLLLADALRHDELADAVHWATELAAIAPNDADARYVLAVRDLEARPPAVPEAKAHLEALQKAEPKRARTAWVAAQVAREDRDDAAVTRNVESARALKLPAAADPVDRMALLQLRLIDARGTAEPAALAARVKAVREAAESLTSDAEPAPNRVARVGRLLDAMQTHLVELARSEPASKADAQAEALEQTVEAIFKKATDPAAAPDPKLFQSYAEHLLLRERRDACLEVVEKGLALPLAQKAAWADVANGLREAGVKAALLDAKDPKRYDRAAPFIKDLLAAGDPITRGIGHLFQGVIDLERSGLADPPAPRGGTIGNAKAADAALQASALKHLKVAAADLPRAAAAQALYGVALLLSHEPALGRQYLNQARQLGQLEPRYEVWVAWSMIQAGYPEEAAPIVTRLFAATKAGSASPALSPMLHLLQGEILQARRTEADLRQARAEYLKAVPAGQQPSPALQLRLAQVEILLGDKAAGGRRLAELNAHGGGPGAEALAILLLKEQKQGDQARARLADARKRYPDSDELAGIDAGFLVDDGKAAEADKLLADFLAKYPDHLDARLSRARLLAGPGLEKPDDAIKLLSEVADGENSAPLVQLALIHMQKRDYTAAAQAIGRLRARWKELATADLLDAQLALAQQDAKAAAAHLDEALRKDPTNKVALFYRAQLDDRAGADSDAARIYESLAREGSSKEVVAGVSLGQAAQWSLASMDLENRDLDMAIVRYKTLLGGGLGADAERQVRWSLAGARAAKGQLAEAKTDVAKLLKDPKTTASERVQAANFFRQYNEAALADAQLDAVLKDRPGHPQAVSIRALMLANAGKARQAADLIRRAIAAEPQPPTLYLMLASTENLTPPAETGPERTIKALDEGLAAHPEAVELVEAKAMALSMKKDPEGAVAFVEAQAKAHPTAGLRRLLVETYRKAGRLDRAVDEVKALREQSPRDAALAALLVELLSQRSILASNRGDRDTEKALDSEALALIRRVRKDFPGDPSFPRAECLQAIRRGELDRALTLTKEIDAIDGRSVQGPLLRAQVYAAKGWAPQVVQAYGEAVERNPRRLDVRLELAQAALATDQPDEAVRQAEFVLKSRPEDPAALLTKARALASQPGPADQVAARRDQALSLLRSALKDNGKNVAFHRQIAEIEHQAGRAAEATKALRAALAVAPDDEASIARLAQWMAAPGRDGKASAAAVQAAGKMADDVAGGDRDPSGRRALALAVGFQKAGQLPLALRWIEAASAKVDAPLTHLTFGDILLSQAEASTDARAARAAFEKAVAEYDKVLKVQANSVEAINNKAWILHRYLDRNDEALALAEGLARRSDPEALPAEFLDTLGAIQESMKKTREAEATFAQGLRKRPDFAMLNYHMGRLIAADSDRADKAIDYLKRAQKARDSLPVTVAAEVDALLQKVGP